MENNKIKKQEQYFKDIADYIELAMIDNISKIEISKNSISIYTTPRKLHKIAAFLRDDLNCSMDILTNIVCVDYPLNADRFELCYFLFSSKFNHRIVLKTLTDGKKIVKTLIDVFSAAAWYEREIWDMFGISFAENPDMRRIFNDFGFKGYPLRKDFSRIDEVKVFYDEKIKSFSLEENQNKNKTPTSSIDEFSELCRNLAEKNCGLIDL